MIQACGLWSGKDRNGNTFLSGSMGNLRILIFRNTFKKNEKEPDYRMYHAERDQEHKPQADGDPLAQDAVQPAQPAEPAQAPPPPDAASQKKEDDIPF